MSERLQPDPAGGPTQDRPVPFPSYEEFSTGLIEALDDADLTIDDLRHEFEPSVGERRFECIARAGSAEPPSRYHAHLSFTWDALMTYITTYGAGADCDLYHDDDEESDCPHQRLVPQPVVEVAAEFVLGDGGYELQNVEEISGWIETAQSLHGKAFPDEEKPSLHVGVAALGGVVVVERFAAEHSWTIDFTEPPDFARIATQVREALTLAPRLADRLPI